MLEKLKNINKGNLLCLELREKLQALATSEDFSLKKGTGKFFCAQNYFFNTNSLFNQFFKKLFEKILLDPFYIVRSEIVFIQNVPRLDYYRESIVEKPNAKIFLNRIQVIFKELINEFNGQEINSKKDFNFFINVYNICLRLGVDRSFLYNFNVSSTDRRLNHRISFIKLITKISFEVSNYDEVYKESLLNLMALAEDLQRDPLLFCSVVNRLVISYSRYYEKDDILESDISGYVNRVLCELNTIAVKTNLELITLSMIYRGIPMSGVFSNNEKRRFLIKAEEILDNFIAVDEIENISKKELKFTLFLTRFKFEHFSGNDILSKKYLSECLELDPENSAIYTELALLSYKNKSYEASKRDFEKAATLGAPNLSMNYYFLGKSLKEMNCIMESKSAFLKSIRYDDWAISPILEIIELSYGDEKRSYIEKVLNSSCLYEQLTEEEKCSLKI